MNFEDAMKAAKNAKDAGLRGIYPLAAQVLSDELKEVLKNIDTVIKLEVLKEREACAKRVRNRASSVSDTKQINMANQCVLDILNGHIFDNVIKESK